MNEDIKDAVMALFVSKKEPEVPLPVAPDASIEIVVCPHCDGDNCEIWNSTEARMAECPECGSQFIPKELDSQAKNIVLAVTESRSHMLHRVAYSEVPDSEVAKGALIRCFSR